MRINNVRNDLLSGKPAIGPFIGLQSANVAELMGNAGFNFVVIESEHNGIDSAEIEHMLMAVGNTDAVPIVRIPSHRQVYIQKALDIGALGIVVPAVKTAEEAAQIVSATKFSFCGLIRILRSTALASFFAKERLRAGLPITKPFLPVYHQHDRKTSASEKIHPVCGRPYFR